jgi:hypothetical protein
MKITTISITYKRTFNLGEYNNLVVEESISADLEEGDTPEGVEAQLWQLAKASCAATALPVVRPRQEALQASFDALPPNLQEAILSARM